MALPTHHYPAEPGNFDMLIVVHNLAHPISLEAPPKPSSARYSTQWSRQSQVVDSTIGFSMIASPTKDEKDGQSEIDYSKYIALPVRDQSVYSDKMG